MQRVYSLKKSNPLAHFKRFQDNLSVLKDEVQAFNKWENCSYALNHMPSRSSDNKKLLKKMTEPKYHQVVVGLIQAKQKSEATLNRKTSLKGLKSLIYTSRVKKTQQPENQPSTNQFFTNFSIQLSRTERVKSRQLKLNIKKKQKKLEQEWSKLDNYRSQHSIYSTQRTFGKSKQQKMIIRKVMRNKPTYSTDESQYYTRNNTFQSECLEMR